MTGSRKESLGAIIMIALFFFGVQFSTTRIWEYDGHFHIRYAAGMIARGFPHQLPELAYSIYSHAYRDHHMLFHVLLIPFTGFGNLYTGAKLAAAFFATLAGISFWCVLRQVACRYRWFWLALFCVGSQVFIFRLSLPRAQSLSLAVMLWVIYALLNRKILLLFVLSVGHVWLYDSFPLVMALVGAWTASVGIVDRKWDLAPLWACLGGVAVGIIVNPYFPENITSYGFNFWRSIVSVQQIPATAEWLPFGFWEFIISNLPLVLVSIAVIVAAGLWSFRRDQVTTFLLVVFLGFLCITFKSRRFIEYMPAMWVLLLARVGSEAVEMKIGWRRAAALVVAASVGIGAGNLKKLIRENQGDDRYLCYQKASLWLSHLPRGTKLYQSDWDDFPFLYINAPQVSYIGGLDPLFMQVEDEDRYNLYNQINDGNVEGSASGRILRDFSARYVFTDEDHGALIEKLDRERGVYRVFSGPGCRIYQIE